MRISEEVVKEILASAKQYFCIPDVGFSIKAKRTKLKRFVDGQTTTDISYRRANIQIDTSKVKTHEQLIETCGHEMAHVFVSQEFDLLYELMLEASDPKTKRMLQRAWQVAEERLVTILGQMFAREYIEKVNSGLTQP